ncbi:FkbM family methyltransferase [Actinomadura barringtoniae]|uniref:FkbM family methyltransferase n=1 Tax=Actinomadura barringtoniae TaxID=1427535 RepID=A0A939T366_9ACTN|nr:FkbM family methyltransferase [Actinomadura barringtoniae]MBO2450681.1 FkbM family methyltransferase [Actinomadura barringtoniae]
MATLRKRALNGLRAFGLQITDIGPGAALLSRRGRRHSLQRLPGSTVIVTKKNEPRKHAYEFQKKLHYYLAAEHIAWILRKYKVNCVIDVGANAGQYGAGLRRAGYKGRIASFEPVPEHAVKLAEAAGNDPEWQVHPFALGREEGTVEMNVVPGFGHLSSMLEPSDFGARTFNDLNELEVAEVPVRRLDTVLDEVLDGIADPRPYLKLDTQGFDLEVFAGAGDHIKEFAGMQSEVALLPIYDGMPGMTEAIGTYQDAGFEVSGMFPVSREPATGRVIEYDCVLVRPETLV